MAFRDVGVVSHEPQLDAAVTLTQDLDGYLLLEDGELWRGRLAGAGAPAAGEVVFTTNLTGYQEVLTDPSFAGQIVVMTAPMIGNYGVTPIDEQALQAVGLRIRGPRALEGFERLAGDREGWKHTSPSTGSAVLVGADTRAITRHVRERGAMRSLIAPVSLPIEDGHGARLAAHPRHGGP